MNDLLILLSGGLDSVVMAHDFVKQGRNVRALHFSLNRVPARAELEAAKKFAFRLNIPLEFADISSLDKLFYGIVPREVLAHGEYDTETGPANILTRGGFNMLLSIAYYFAQTAAIDEIAVAVIKQQTRYNPNSKNYFEEYPNVLNHLTPELKKLSINTPYIGLNKSDVVKKGIELGVPLDETWTCQHGGVNHCGVCDGCKSRKFAFKQAGVSDSTIYIS